ncbi:hypothetical protein [Pseudomonas japonica]|uniref:hypothetical protein n=1 Tax=Pseudomonas japonica TaxID=256466 RepID=UPI0015E3B277|nr:hypothetical protein [Pseudomonas japonica]
MRAIRRLRAVPNEGLTINTEPATSTVTAPTGTTIAVLAANARFLGPVGLDINWGRRALAAVAGIMGIG